MGKKKITNEVNRSSVGEVGEQEEFSHTELGGEGRVLVARGVVVRCGRRKQRTKAQATPGGRKLLAGSV